LIAKELTHVKHVFLDRKLATSKKGDKVGLEHMKDEDIIAAFQMLHALNTSNVSDITSTFLYEMGLMGHTSSQAKRQQLSTHLHIGDVNGKTLMKRLIAFGYTQKDIIEVMNDTSSQKAIRPELPQR
jgi:ribonuclease M5